MILCLSAFTFTACVDREKYIGIEGSITDKEHREAHTTTTFIWTGKSGFPVITRHPEAWYLTVKYYMDGETEEIEYKVTEEIYNTYEIGDTYIYNGEQEQ